MDSDHADDDAQEQAQAQAVPGDQDSDGPDAVEKLGISNLQPSLLSLFAQKSIIHLEGIETSPEEIGGSSLKLRNRITLTILQGMASGTLSLIAVKNMHRFLESKLG